MVASASIVSAMRAEHADLESRLDARLDAFLDARLASVHQTLTSVSATQTESLVGAIDTLRALVFTSARSHRVEVAEFHEILAEDVGSILERLSPRRNGHQSWGAQSRGSRSSEPVPTNSQVRSLRRHHKWQLWSCWPLRGRMIKLAYFTRFLKSSLS